ncbi:MAG: hypothetical protein PHE61_04005 [Candidatus Omnitrophica bacterium]|nr:hypothetical protein [Candidatus Omnitrophota bacterium]
MEQDASLTVGGWFSRGWSTFKKSPKQLIGGSLILTALGLVLVFIGLVPGGVFVMAAVQIVVLPVLTVGWCFFCLRIARGESVKVLDVFNAFSCFGRAWTTSILLFLIVLGGIVLLIVPGIIWALKYGLCFFAVMDKNLRAREAIRFSGEITKGHKGKLFMLGLIAYLFGLLAYPFYIGIQGLGEDLGPTFVVAGIVPYLVSVLVVTPWIGATAASAYDSLANLSKNTSAAGTN